MGDAKGTTTGWERRPIVGWSIRVTLVVLPFIAGWIAIRLTKASFIEPAGLPRLLSWIVQAIVISVTASFATTRALRWLTPLPALFNMTLVFPDHAPSRFGVALRSGTVRKLLQERDLRLSADAQEAAEQALVLVNQLSAHERLTRGHTERVRAFADLIGQQLGLEPHELNQLRWGALLHDIGKLKVPSEILSKPGVPTEEEWTILRQHPAEAATILEPFSPWLGRWVLAASEHHERWDGTGYPLGLSGTDISLPGRITAVADAFDVITSHRSYKAPMSLETARRELVASAGTHFDPAVVRAMLEVGLNEQHRVHPFGWLLEIPGLARAVEVGVATPLAALAATVIAAASFATPSQTDLALMDVPPPSTSVVTEATPASTTELVVDTTAPPPSVPSTTTAIETTTTTSAPTTDAPPPTTAAPTTTAPATVAPTTTVALTGCELALSGQTDIPNANLAGCDLSGRTIDGLNFSGADLTNADLSNVVVQNFTMDGATLVGVNLSGASFTDGSFANAVMPNVDGTGMSLTRVNLDNVNWSGALLNDTILSEVSFLFSNLTSASFQRTSIAYSQLQDATLTDADFTNSTLSFVGFERSNLTRASFLGANPTSVTAGGAVHEDTICPAGDTSSASCF